MKILLVGNGTRQNRGCEAITLTTLDLIRGNIPDATVEIFSLDPGIDAPLAREGVRVCGPILQFPPIPSLPQRVMRKLGLLPAGQLARITGVLPYTESLPGCDLVLSLGGDNYTDDYGIGSARFFWNLARWARRHGKPFVIWGASVGPFRSPESLELARKGLGTVAAVTARENETVAYLSSIGYGGNVIRVYDSAFLLQPEPVPLPEFGAQRDLIGFNISPIFHKYTSRPPEQILAESRDIVRKLTERYNVLLVPHVMYEGDHNDARYMQQLLVNDSVRMADPDHDCRRLKYLISRCRIFIGARTHATIAAFSSGVPTISLGYSMKAQGINREIFGNDDFLVEAADFGVDAVLSAVSRTEERIGWVRETLARNQAEVAAARNRGIEAALALVPATAGSR